MKSTIAAGRIRAMTESLICLPSVPLNAESAKAKFQLLLALVMGSPEADEPFVELEELVLQSS
jgi:hypothetical protein